MLKNLLPKEVGFFDYFEQHIKLTNEGCRELLAIAANKDDLGPRVARIKEVEHKADAVTHACIEELHKTFVTPFERGDIHNLIKGLDNIIDAVDSAASWMAIYEVKEVRHETLALAEVLIAAVREIEIALKKLRTSKKLDDFQEHCTRLHQLESEGDAILRSALARLFKEGDPLLVIKWKEIYERLEQATDHCEKVANIIEGVILEAS